jgi:transcriptional regulator with XRE-family HTH domain
MDTAKIGKFLKDLRLENHLIKEKLGDKIGTTNKTVFRWEIGAYLPPVDMLLSLSELYSVSITEILHDERIMKNFKEVSESTMVDTLKENKYEAYHSEKKIRKEWLKKHIFEPLLEVALIYGVAVIANHYEILYLNFLSLSLTVA